MNEQAYKVCVVYAPEGKEKFSSEECLPFSNRKNAVAFRDRQEKKKNVMSTRLYPVCEYNENAVSDRMDET